MIPIIDPDEMVDNISGAIYDCLESGNESAFAKHEPANVVDGLFAIARAIDRLAKAIQPSTPKPKPKPKPKPPKPVSVPVEQ